MAPLNQNRSDFEISGSMSNGKPPTQADMFASASANFNRQLEQVRADIVREFGEVGSRILDLPQLERMSNFELDGLLVHFERIALRKRLEAVFVPPVVACWIAQRWPGWLFPVILAYRVQQWLERVRDG
jgi:hypothetical protein